MTNPQNPDILAARYREANGNFNRALVFRIGVDAGFFAEFKYLVHAIIYCLRNNLQLRLYSRRANFAYEKGWCDFFKPFCDEVYEPYHSYLNVHSLPPLGHLRKSVGGVGLPGLAVWKMKTAACNRLCRWANRISYGAPALSTSDIPPYRPEERTSIPAMNFEGTYLEAFRMVATMLWRFNDETRMECRKLVNALTLPREYAATQVRGGDKITEVDLYKPSLFADLILRSTDLRDVLLLTDDYRIYERLANDYPQIRWSTLCTPEEKGYFNKSFAGTAAADKRRQMLRLLAQVDAMRRASFFTGSITVGPSLFLLEMASSGGLAADCAPENLNMAAQLSIPERDAIARRYLKEGKG